VMAELVIASASYGVYARDALEKLEAFFSRCRRVVWRSDTSEQKIVDDLRGAQALILGGSGSITSSVMESLPELLIIARHGLGLDNVDLKAATRLGIPVTFCRHTGEEVSVAEHTMALILAAARRIVEADAHVRAGRWMERVNLAGVELRGKVLGVIGLGAVGREVARIAGRGFGMRVWAYDPYAPDEVFEELGVRRVTLDELLEGSDVVTIHVPLTEETRRLLDGGRLGRLKRGAILVNTARGAVVDEEALFRLLNEGRIAYAGLDVFSREPLENSPLTRLSNVVLTPHIAAFTREALWRMDMAIADDLIGFFRGKRPGHLANPEVFERGLRAPWFHVGR